VRVAESRVNPTPSEPEWKGFVTFGIANTTPLPAKVYANEGLCQILFFRSDEAYEISNADPKGKSRTRTESRCRSFSGRASSSC
jgi:dCTP deaminase